MRLGLGLRYGGSLQRYSGGVAYIPPPPSIPTTALGWAGRKEDAAETGGDVTFWEGLNGTGTATINGTPTKVSDQIYLGTSNYFTLPSPLVMTGPWTVYIVHGTRALGQSFAFASNTLIGIGVLTNTVFARDDTFAAYATLAGLPAWSGVTRIRRTAANVIKISRTGAAEADLGGTTQTGTFTFSKILACPNHPLWTDAAIAVDAMMIYAADTVADGTDPDVMAWIDGGFYVAPPPSLVWGNDTDTVYWTDSLNYIHWG